MNILYTNRAKFEIEVAFDWYENQKEGLGIEFINKIEQSLETIKEFPESSQIIYKTFRRLIIKRFPFSVFYTIEAEGIIIHAVFDNRRDPKKLP